MSDYFSVIFIFFLYFYIICSSSIFIGTVLDLIFVRLETNLGNPVETNTIELRFSQDIVLLV